MLGWLLRVGAPALMKIKMELMMKGKCKTDNCWDAGDGRKRCSPLSRNMSGPVMSLPVSYEIKTCYYHNSITLTLRVKLQGAPKKKEKERETVSWGHEIIARIPFNFQKCFLLYVRVLTEISEWRRDVINYISIHIMPESFREISDRTADEKLAAKLFFIDPCKCEDETLPCVITRKFKLCLTKYRHDKTNWYG